MSNRVISGIGWTAASSIMRNLVSLLQMAILTRFLVKADFGIVAIANLFVGFTSLFLDMGISAGIIYRQEISKKEYSSLFWLNIFFGIGLTVLLYLLAPVLTAKYQSEDLTNVVRLICFTILFSSLGNQQRTYCQKMTYFKRLSVIETVGYLSTFVVTLLAAFKGCGVYSLAYSTLAGSVVLNMTHFVVALLKDNRLKFHFCFKETLPFLKIGIYQVGSSVLDFFTRELDVLIISATIGLEFLGIYDIAKRVPTALFSLILPVVNRVFPPILAEVNTNKYLLKHTYMKLAKVMSWFSFPMYFLLAALSPTILSVVFGVDYMVGVPVMIIFSLKYAFSGTNTICGALQVATGRTDVGLKWTIYSIASTALVYIVFAQWGVKSFLFGMSLVILLNIYMLWFIQFRTMTQVSCKEYISIFSISCIISLILSTIVYLIFSQSSIIYALVSSLTFLLLYCIILINSKDGGALLEILDSLPIPNFIIQSLKIFKRVHY